VAYHIALKAKGAAGRRRAQERQALDMPRAESGCTEAWRELRPVLDEELNRLPAKYRDPFLLCYLDGKSNSEAARLLGCPAGTVKSRLARARDLLRQRLTRRGVALSGSALALVLAENTAAAVPNLLLDATIKNALLFGVRKAAGAASAPAAAALAEGVLKTMLANKCKLALLSLLAVGLVSLAVAAFAYQALAQKPGGPDQPPPAWQKAQKPEAKTAPAARGGAKDARTMTVTGKVLDTDNKPVANADVLLVGIRQPDPSGKPYRQDVHVQDKTDAKGRFRLAVPNATPQQFYRLAVLARAKGFGLGWSRLMNYPGQPLNKPEIRLRPEQVIKGRFLDLQGIPAAKVTVQVATILGDRSEGRGGVLPPRMVMPRPGFEDDQRRQAGFSFVDTPGPKDAPLWPKTVTTDAQGRYEIRGFGRDQGVEVLVQGERYATQKFILESGHSDKPKEIVRTLTQPQRFEGKVVYEDTGKPATKVWVAIQSFRGFRGQETGQYTDAQGCFKINPYPGDSFAANVFAPRGQPYLHIGRNFNWPRASVVQNVEFTLPRGVVLHGKVTNKTTDKPVAGARVYFQQLQANNPNRVPNLQPPSYYPAVSAADGSYELVSPASNGHLLCDQLGQDYIRQVIGSEELRAGKPGGQRRYVHGFVSLNLKPQKGPKEVNIAVRRGVTLRGKVVGPDGKKVARALVFASGELTAGRGGQFFLPALPGSIQAGWLWVKDGRFELPGCDPKKTYRLIFLNTKSGNDASGAPQLYMAPGGARFGGGLGSETGPLFRDGKDRLGAVVDITPPTEAKKTVTIKLAPCGSATIRMVDAKGKPAPRQANLDLEIAPQQGKGKAALEAELMTLAVFWPMGTPPTPDAQGRLTIPALIPGATYRFKTAFGPGEGVKTFKVEAGKKAELGDLVIQ
jgi:hypothetical protein